MEFEFDKEIDAILRKSRGVGGTAVLAAASPHVDADTIAAFSENALPEKTRLLFTRHLADCDRCRTMLSQTIMMRTGADAAAASSVSEPVVATPAPWYVKIFRTPNLAFAMGGLVLVFSGLLGYMVLQNRQGTSNATVSQATEQEEPRGGPYFNDQAQSAPSNTAANSMPAMTNTAVNSAPAANAPAAAAPLVSTETSTATSSGVATSNSNVGSAFNTRQITDLPVAGRTATGLDSLAMGGAKPAAAPPPDDKTIASRDEKKDAGKLKALKEETERQLDRDDAQRSMAREAVPMPMSKTGPNRAAGPRQNQQTQNTVTDGFINSGTKNVGGKHFEFRSGAWYDSTYHNQSTINVRRGTDDYTKLDGGLRSIADSVGGVVVVVWKSKAYRIQ